jgi:hypothetical protein
LVLGSIVADIFCPLAQALGAITRETRDNLSSIAMVLGPGVGLIVATILIRESWANAEGRRLS